MTLLRCAGTMDEPRSEQPATAPTGRRRPTPRQRRLRLALRLVLLAGVAGLGYLFRDELGAALLRLTTLHPLVLLVLPVVWLAHYFACRGWRRLLVARDRSERVLPPWRLAVIRIEAQGVNLLVPLVAIGGEALRAAATARSSSLGASTLAVVLDNAAATAGTFLFCALWLGTRIHGGPLEPPQMVLGVVVSALIGILFGYLPFWLARWLGDPRDGAPRLRRALARWFGDSSPALRRAAHVATLWHVAERMMTGVEIYLIGAAFGLSVGPLEAMFATAWMTVATQIFFFIPAQVGAAEGGLASAFTALGLDAADGLAVALVRRARQVIVAAIGLLLLTLVEGRSKGGVDDAHDSSGR